MKKKRDPMDEERRKDLLQSLAFGFAMGFVPIVVIPPLALLLLSLAR